MSTLTPVVLDPIAARGASLGEATRSAENLQQRTAAFDAALGRQSNVAAVQPPVQLAQVQTPASTTQIRTSTPTQSTAAQSAATPATEAADATERARRALELNRASDPSKASGGDLILDGLQKLRGTFDAQQGKVSGMMKANLSDASALLAMQVEVVNYTLMIDVTSKLTGKTTQSFDTLMKGQ